MSRCDSSAKLSHSFVSESSHLESFLKLWSGAESGVDAKLRFIVGKQGRLEVESFLKSLSLPHAVKDVVAFQKAFYLSDHSNEELELVTDEELALKAIATIMCRVLRSSPLPSVSTQSKVIMAYFGKIMDMSVSGSGDAAVKHLVLDFIAVLRKQMETEEFSHCREECEQSIREILQRWKHRIEACGLSMKQAEDLAGL